MTSWLREQELNSESCWSGDGVFGVVGKDRVCVLVCVYACQQRPRSQMGIMASISAVARHESYFEILSTNNRTDADVTTCV